MRLCFPLPSLLPSPSLPGHFHVMRPPCPLLPVRPPVPPCPGAGLRCQDMREKWGLLGTVSLRLRLDMLPPVPVPVDGSPVSVPDEWAPRLAKAGMVGMSEAEVGGGSGWWW